MTARSGTEEPTDADTVRSGAPEPPAVHDPSTRLIRTGLVLFGLGVAVIIWTFIDFAVGRDERPLWQNLLCLLAPLGFALALSGVVANSRTERRAAMAMVAGAQQDHSPIRLSVPPGRVERVFAWLAAAEATSWLLLIVATIVKYAQGSQLAVHVLGPVHGALFTGYVILAAAVWWRRRWSLLTVLVVGVDSIIPGGGFLVARRADLR